MTPKKKTPPPPREFLLKLKRLDLPAKTKAILKDLYAQSTSLVRRLVEFLYHNRIFSAYLLLGVCLYFALGPIPLVGALLASLGLSFSVLMGLFRQFEADMQRQVTVFVGKPA